MLPSYFHKHYTHNGDSYFDSLGSPNWLRPDENDLHFAPSLLFNSDRIRYTMWHSGHVSRTQLVKFNKKQQKSHFSHNMRDENAEYFTDNA